MSRLLPIQFLALLPVAVAAPVPRDVRPEFGANGLLSRTDLAKVRFASRSIKERDKAGESTPERDANNFDIAVHMPWTTFREGEPIPAYFVLRNNSKSVLGLTSRVDFSRYLPQMHGDAVSFDVRDRATGESVRKAANTTTNCGGGSLVDVPANGYYVMKADLSVATGVLLPPGEYEVDWVYGPRAAAAVRFSVTNSDARRPNPPPPFPTKEGGVAERPSPPGGGAASEASGVGSSAHLKRPELRFFHMTEGSEYLDRAEKVREIDESNRKQEAVTWRETYLSETRTDSLSAALAVGQNGVYIPDVRTIPSADKLVEAWMEWKPYRDGDRMVVTLRAAPGVKEVRFEELPELYLQIEAPDGTRERWGREHEGDAKLHAILDRSLVTPLTIEARLPEGWRERTGITGVARVAVLVTSKRLELQRGCGDLVKKALQEIERAESARERRPLWSGTLRTDFVELQFPPLPPPIREEPLGSDW